MATAYPGGLRKRGGLLDYEDTIQATPRNPFFGGVADLLGQAYKLPEMPRLGVPGLDFVAANRNRLMDLLGVGDVQKTAEAISYGNRLGTGTGMTYQPLPETVGAAMALAPFAGKAIRATEGLPVGASIKLVDDVAPQAEALRLAQQRAALPVEQGGLGLLESNTAMDRARAMGFDTDVYHGSKQNFDKFKGDQPIFAAEDPDIARLYGSFIYPLKLRGKVLEVSDLGKGGAVNRFPNNLAKELNIPRKELEELRMPRQQFNDSSFLDKLEYLFNKRFGDPQFSDIGEREMVNKLPKYGIDRMRVTDMNDMGGIQTQHMIPAGSENIRSRFAAFDPFRRTAATAAAMGVAAPDLLAAEMQEEMKRRQLRGLLAP